MTVRESVRTFGRFQLRSVGLLLLFGVPATNWANLGILIIAPSVPHTCASYNYSTSSQPLAFNISSDHCLANNIAHCRNFSYSHVHFDYTITERFNLICDRTWLINLASTVYMLGYFVGSAGSGMLADRFGRKTVVVGASVSACLANVLSACSPVMSVYLVARFLLGILDIAIYTSGLVLVAEMVRKDQRLLVKAAETFAAAVICALLGALAFLIRDYRYIHVLVACTCLLYATTMALFTCESPRWLAAKNRDEEANRALRRIEAFNGKPTDWLHNLPLAEDSTSFTHLFRTPNIRRRSSVLFVVWLAVVLVYYAITYNLGSFSSDIRLGMVISFSIDAPGAFLVFVMIKRLGRQTTTFILMSIASVCCLSMVPLVLSSSSTALFVLAIGGKVMASNLFILIYLYTPELYPTVIRNSGLGACSSVARVGGMLAPQLSLLNSFWPASMVLTLGLVALLAAGLIPLLPDTTGAELLQSVEEGEQFCADHGYGLRLPRRKGRRRQTSELEM